MEGAYSLDSADKLKKTVGFILQNGYEKYFCTVCNFEIPSDNISEGIFVPHPILDVLICKRCHRNYIYKHSIQVFDKGNLCCWCHNPDREIRSCTSCPLKFCTKCLNRNLNNDFNEIWNSNSWRCVKCDLKPLRELRNISREFTRIIGNNRIISSLKNEQQNPSQNSSQSIHSNLRKRRNSWNGISNSKTTECNAIKNKLINKSDELLYLFEKVNKEIVDFKTKIDKNFTINHANKAFSFLKELIKTTKCTLDLWDLEIGYFEQSCKENDSSNQESPKGEKKKKINLSLKEDTNIDTKNEHSTVSSILDSSQSNIHINEGDNVQNVMENGNDGGTEKEEKHVPDNVISEQFDNECDSSDSIFSHATQIITNRELAGLVDELDEANGESMPRNNASEEVIGDRNGEESDSEKSFVIYAQEYTSNNDLQQVENDAIDELNSTMDAEVASLDYQNSFCNFSSDSEDVKKESDLDVCNNTKKVDATLMEPPSQPTPTSRSNISDDVDDVFVETSFDWRAPKDSSEDSDNNDVQKITFFHMLDLVEKGENCDVQIDTMENQQKRAMERILRNIDEELFHISDDNSVSDVDDIDVVDQYLNLPEGVIGIVTHKLPSLPSDPDTTSVHSDINKETSNLDAHFNLKDCSVVLEKVEVSSDSENETERIKMTVDDEEREIERLLNLDVIGRKRKPNSLTASTKAKKCKKSKEDVLNGISDSDSNLTSDEEDESLIVAEESVTAPACQSPTADQTDILDDLLNAMNDDDDDFLSEMEKDISSLPMKKRRRSLSTDSNKENCPEDSSVSNEPIGEDPPTTKADWKSDPLLRSSLSCKKGKEQKGQQLDIDVEGDSILPDNLKQQMEISEAKKLNKGKDLVQNNKITPSNELDNVSISSDDDIEEKYSKIIINSESDSDIEFVSVAKKKSPTKKPKKRLTQVENDHMYIKTETSDEESGNKKKGRRNIRAILGDEILDEATKRANLIEKERKSRLTQRHKNMNSILSQSQYSEETEGLILDIDEVTKLPTIVVHPKITQRFKQHQKDGVQFMWDSCYEGVKQIKKAYSGNGCILAHCMGLGKTIQVIALIHTLFAHPVTKTKSVVIVCPLSVVLNWRKEFEDCFKMTSDNIVNVYDISDGSCQMRRWFLVEQFRENGGVLIVGYECFTKLISPKDPTNISRQEANIIKTLCNPGPDLIVLDEGHLIKNGKAERSKALQSVKTKRRIVLTGTPLQNNLMEYYYMVQFTKPNLLGSLHEYKNRFVNPITNGQYDDSTESDIVQMKKRSHVLHKLLKGTIQRFEVSELRPYLSKKHDYALFVALHPLQMNLYDKKIDIENNTSTEASLKQLVTNYHKFQIIWTHPYMFELKKNQKMVKQVKKGTNDINLDVVNDDLWWQSLYPDDCSTNIDYGPKFKVMLSIIKESENLGDKVLVFSNSLVELNAIEHFLQLSSTPACQWEREKDYIRLDGSTPPETRVQLCNSFNDNANVRGRLFLISARAGGLGLNLTGANRVILMDVSWNPAQDNQSVFRTYRFGQEKECYVYRLVSMGTMEEVVYERQITKLAVAGRVVDSMQICRHYKSNDLQMIYRSNFKNNEVRPTLPLPTDNVLASVLQSCEEVFKYHEHQSLLENLPEENLNEDEMKIAWDEFHKENELKHELMEQQKRRVAALQTAPNGLPTPTTMPNNSISNVNVSKNLGVEPVNLIVHVPATLQSSSSSNAIFVQELPKLNTSTHNVFSTEKGQSNFHHNGKPAELHTYVQQSTNKTENVNANVSTNNEASKLRLGYTLPQIVNVVGGNNNIAIVSKAKNVKQRNITQPYPTLNISSNARHYNPTRTKSTVSKHVNPSSLGKNDHNLSKTHAQNLLVKWQVAKAQATNQKVFKNPASVARRQLNNFPPLINIDKQNCIISKDIPSTSTNSKGSSIISKSPSTATATVTSVDAVIDIDDISDEDLRKKEQQALLTSLNRNLDITLSAITSKQDLHSGNEMASLFRNTSKSNESPKQDDVIEID